MRLPFVRGLVVLYDTLVTGTRWLVRSATLQALAFEEGGGRSEADRQGETRRPSWRRLVPVALVPALGAAADGSAGGIAAGDAGRGGEPRPNLMHGPGCHPGPP